LGSCLNGVSWFHFSAICPALNQAAADVCLEAVKAASERNITISIDLNYRAKLWQYGKQPADVIPQLVQYCDLVMGNIWAAEKMLNISVPENIHQHDDKNTYLEQAKVTSETILEQYPKCKWVANTFRFDFEKGIRYYTTLYTNNELLVSEEYVSTSILDKVGSGDCFMAGLIYGLYKETDPLKTLNFATAAAFSKLFIPSDCTTSTVADIEQTIAKHDQE
jgi:2-dehydro-3-deoxygluconokinase